MWRLGHGANKPVGAIRGRRHSRRSLPWQGPAPGWLACHHDLLSSWGLRARPWPTSWPTSSTRASDRPILLSWRWNTYGRRVASCEARGATRGCVFSGEGSFRCGQHTASHLGHKARRLRQEE